MPKRTLVLINPVNPRRRGLTTNRSGRFPPIGLGAVAALTPRDWDVVLIDENWERFSYHAADLVGMTAFTASANRAYEIASAYRERGTPVVMGGMHASMCPDEALRFVDAVVVGEADAVWPGVIADFDAGRLREVYEGEWSSLAGLPRPRRDLFHPGYMFASVQTSRGCPMDCVFCSVAALNGSRYRRRPPGEVLDELETVPQRVLFFVDDNLVGCDGESRDQALEIFHGMVERRLNKWWFCQASINFADDEETMRWAAKAGCRMVILGLEAEKATALEEVEKRLNAARGVESYEDSFRRIHQAGIAILGAFMFGLDGDTPDDLRDRAEYMIRSGVDAMQATLLTPLPGTRLFATLGKEGRLLHTDFPKDWERYDTTEVVHRPRGMGPDDLSRIMRECARSIYARPVLARKATQALLRTGSAVAAAIVWRMNMNWRDAILSGDGPVSVHRGLPVSEGLLSG